MAGCRPHDRFPVAATDEEQALAAGAGAVIARHQLAPFNHVPQRPQRGNELAPGAAGVALVRNQQLLPQWHALTWLRHFGANVDALNLDLAILALHFALFEHGLENPSRGFAALRHQRTPR